MGRDDAPVSTVGGVAQDGRHLHNRLITIRLVSLTTRCAEVRLATHRERFNRGHMLKTCHCYT
jgi:hypothetical protein